MGGRELKFSLLSAYFLITDEDFRVLDQLFLNVKPDDGVYMLSGQGMNVNGINIQEHDKIAVPYKQAKPILFNFLKKNSVDGRLTPVGHAVKGDISHVIQNLISEGSWEQFCTYHFIDTSVVLQFLRACGLMPLDCDGSVGALAEFMGIEYHGKLHDPEVDSKITAQILKTFIYMVKKNNVSNISSPLFIKNAKLLIAPTNLL